MDKVRTNGNLKAYARPLHQWPAILVLIHEVVLMINIMIQETYPHMMQNARFDVCVWVEGEVPTQKEINPDQLLSLPANIVQCCLLTNIIEPT